MGGGSKTETTHQTQSNTIDPMQMAQYQQNYQNAQNTVGALKPYTGQITAGFNPLQTQSQGILSTIAQDPRYQQVNQSAIDTTQGLLAANPNTTVNAQPYDPSQLANTDLSKYYNPFQKDVIDASISQNEYARNQAQVHDQQAATHAGSFQGAGTRQGVAMGETNAGYDRNNQQNLAALNSANFGQAQSAALSDIGAQNAAKQFNSTQGVNAQQNSITNALAQAGYKLNAAGQLVALNDASLNTATKQGGILAAVGDTQQAQQQKELSDAYNAYLQGQQLTLAQQQALNQALGIIPIQQTNTTDGTVTQKSNPGMGGILSSVASLGMGLASLPTSSLGGGLLGGLFGAAKPVTQGPFFPGAGS